MGTKIRARVVGDEAELGPFSTLVFFGTPLTSEWSDPFEVEDGVLTKLKGNRFVEVQVRRQKGAEADLVSEPAPAEAPTPEAEPVAAEAPPAELG